MKEAANAGYIVILDKGSIVAGSIAVFGITYYFVTLRPEGEGGR